MTLAGTVQRAIRHWWGGGGGTAGSALRTLAAPLEGVYRDAVARRNRRFDRARGVRPAGLRIVSVGNLVVGGTGKTPLAAWTAEVLAASGARVALLSGGYGRDEILLHRRWNPHVPVIVARSRVSGARLARERGADVAVLDDGFQHRSLARDLDVVVIAAEDPFPGRLLPRGPYREPVASLTRAQVAVVTRRTAGPDRAEMLGAEIARRFPHLALGRLAFVSSGWQDVSGLAALPPEGPILAVTAVACPERFLAQVAIAVADGVELMAFGDHHEYDASDVRAMRSRAGERTLVVTEKDAVKLQPFQATLEPIRVLVQTPRWEAGEGAVTNLLTAVGKAV